MSLELPLYWTPCQRTITMIGATTDRSRLTSAPPTTSWFRLTPGLMPSHNRGIKVFSDQLQLCELHYYIILILLCAALTMHRQTITTVLAMNNIVSNGMVDLGFGTFILYNSRHQQGSEWCMRRARVRGVGAAANYQTPENRC